MYQDYFGLEKPPFRITPDTHLFFDGSDRGAVLKALCFAVSQGEGIMKVVGEVGSGKTMLCRMLPTTLSEDIVWVYLAHPSLSPEHTLHAIAYELGLDIEQSAEKLQVMRALHSALLDMHNQGQKVVVLVEEAQGMPLESLEEIRLLSNLETDDYKLMQIILFGQPELDDKLAKPSIRQLKERITLSIMLDPLKLDDIHQYLNFRLRAVGYKGPDLFSPKVAKKIAYSTDGLIRRINILADKMLLLAYTENRYTLTLKDVSEAVRDSEFKKKNWWMPTAVFS